MPPAPILVLDALTKRYPSGSGEVTALAGVDLSIAAGELVAVVGPSGSGKSTLLGLVAGLDAPTSGRVLIEGRDLAGLSDGELAALRGRRMGFVFQSYRLLAPLTAEENVRVPLDLAGVADAGAIARSWLERVGLGGRARHVPSQLSGGEQQRVALARALATRPALIFADEPTGNLDQATGEAMATLLIDLVRESHATCVLVTHEPRLAERAERIIEMADGRVMADWRP